ncbi:hypothetical protein HanHA300_Chr06g0219611 [Helianthus annuus]|nr:hypothetical protein HanHA300_Chr06g0219611 [Helianthus annuus]
MIPFGSQPSPTPPKSDIPHPLPQRHSGHHPRPTPPFTAHPPTTTTIMCHLRQYHFILSFTGTTADYHCSMRFSTTRPPPSLPSSP